MVARLRSKQIIQYKSKQVYSGSELKRIRELLGLTKRWFAELISYSVKAISILEKRLVLTKRVSQILLDIKNGAMDSRIEEILKLQTQSKLNKYKSLNSTIKIGGKKKKKIKVNKCHPDKPYFANDMCHNCYNRSFKNMITAKCHPMRAHVAKGKCRKCYDYDKKREKKITIGDK